MTSCQFQFHKGSINTMSLIMLQRSLVRFNSIKVRLILSYKLQERWLSQFQFHKGSINTVSLNHLL